MGAAHRITGTKDSTEDVPGLNVPRQIPHYVPRQIPHYCRTTRGYRPAASVAAASVLRWVPYDAAVSIVRRLIGASHEDLRLRVQLLSMSLSDVFFDDDADRQVAPFAASVRFPEGRLYVCTDLPPLASALLAVQRTMMQVSVLDASHNACDWYYDTVAEAMKVLVGDCQEGPVVFGQAAFESAFMLEWCPCGYVP